MKKRHYPAVLERGPKGTFGAWFPDFPDCVTAGRTYEETVEKAEHALAQAIDTLAEQNGALPEPTPIEQVVLPKGSDLVAYLIIGVIPPDPSERVNVYLPKSLVERIDRRAAELGMTRSSFFGLAASSALRGFLQPSAFHANLSEQRSKARKTGKVRLRNPSAKKPSP